MEIHLGVKPATYEDGTKLSDVMRWNTYGTETIPPRPVLRIAAEKLIDSKKFKKRMKAYLHDVMIYSLYNQGDLKEIEHKLFTAIGQQSIAEAKRIIQAGVELQYNAPSTVKKKGFDKPLFETGLMIENLAYELNEE